MWGDRGGRGEGYSAIKPEKGSERKKKRPDDKKQTDKSCGGGVVRKG